MELSTSALQGTAVVTAPESASASSKQRKDVFAISLGNGLEIYDFTVYGFFAAVIGQLFFNVGSPVASLLLSFATFGVGFVMRPLGSLLIGNYADRCGRKAGLTLTIGLMTLGTALIALTPTYDTIGVAAPIILVIGRLLQGLSAGGEVGTAGAALLESTERSNRCYTVAWGNAAQGVAALCGALVGFAVNGLLDPEQIHSWGWRVPFIIGLLIGPVGLYIRRNLDETHVADASATAPVITVLKTQWRTVLLGILMFWTVTALMYVEIFYMPTYLTTELHYPTTTAFTVAIIAGLCLSALPTPLGRICDRLKSRKSMPLIGFGLAFVAVYPQFMLLQSSTELWQALAVMCVMITLFAVSGSSIMVLILEAFRREHRASGLSIIYGFGVTIFGGFTPLLVTSLIAWTGNQMMPAFYLMTAIVVSATAMLFFPTATDND